MAEERIRGGTLHRGELVELPTGVDPKDWAGWEVFIAALIGGPEGRAAVLEVVATAEGRALVLAMFKDWDLTRGHKHCQDCGMELRVCDTQAFGDGPLCIGCSDVRAGWAKVKKPQPPTAPDPQSGEPFDPSGAPEPCDCALHCYQLRESGDTIVRLRGERDGLTERLAEVEEERDKAKVVATEMGRGVDYWHGRFHALKRELRALREAAGRFLADYEHIQKCSVSSDTSSAIFTIPHSAAALRALLKESKDSVEDPAHV